MKGENELRDARAAFDAGLKGMFDVLGSGRVPPLQTIYVEKGNTLWALAEKHLGDPQRWREIYIMNIDVITDSQDTHRGDQSADLIYPGTEFRCLAI